jgi:hypothetical protein
MQIVVGKLEGKWMDEEQVNIGVPEVGNGGCRLARTGFEYG